MRKRQPVNYPEVWEQVRDIQNGLDSLTASFPGTDGWNRARTLASRASAAISDLHDELKELLGHATVRVEPPRPSTIVDIVNEATGLNLDWAEINEMLRAER